MKTVKHPWSASTRFAGEAVLVSIGTPPMTTWVSPIAPSNSWTSEQVRRKVMFNDIPNWGWFLFIMQGWTIYLLIRIGKWADLNDIRIMRQLGADVEAPNMKDFL